MIQRGQRRKVPDLYELGSSLDTYRLLDNEGSFARTRPDIWRFELTHRAASMVDGQLDHADYALVWA